ncbi:serine/threonine-protein kinase [Tahibacter amnicola]|uniref:Serine/threonine protein kinase n=1 Tax=Tahibacter amnicola TaxID=2976241 RepID=A0ABY6BEZ9_9GAMM|nr:serine/threonine-protein kinase [Tahibacter amnicola]UXI67843.1 serine/threonine protein kinase [Tahibacter amnicola]
MQARPGDRLGPYQLTETLAVGGMARLFRALDTRDGREVVVKWLAAGADESLRARFARETAVLGELDHPHIVPLLDAGSDDGQLYLVLPLLRQGDLADRINREDGPLPLAQVRRIGLELCEALGYAHLRGVVHRDLKPANVLLDEDDTVHLADFGIALTLGAERLTQAGHALGTPEYLAPEQAQGVADFRSDVYALGVILYQMATGRLPFRARGAADWLRAHRDEAVVLPRTLNPHLPEPFERVILHALAKSPEKRFQSAAEMAAAMRQALPDSDVDAYSPTLPTIRTDETPTRVIDADTLVALPTGPVRAPAARRFRFALVGAIAVVIVAATIILSRKPAVSPPAGASPGSPAPAPVPAPPVASTGAPAPAPPPPDAFDDFDGAAFDGAFDTKRWGFTREDPRQRYIQRNGAMTIDSPLREQGLVATFGAIGLSRMVTRARLTAPVIASDAAVGMTVVRSDQPDRWISCYVYATRGALRATPTCTDQRRREFPAGDAGALSDWQELAFHFDAGAAQIRINGRAVGQLPATPDDIQATWYVMLSSWSGDAQNVTGEVDWIVVEPAG